MSWGPVMRDAILLEKLNRGDPKGLELLMQAYLPYVSVIVWNILRGSMAPEDAEEVVSDVFLAAWNQAADLECGHIKSWLGAVARNKAKNKLRQRGRSLPLEEDLLDLPGLSDPTTQLEQAEEQELVRRAVDALPEDEREIFLRHYYYTQPVKEISLTMSLNESTVKSKLRRGRMKLKEALMKGGALE